MAGSTGLPFECAMVEMREVLMPLHSSARFDTEPHSEEGGSDGGEQEHFLWSLADDDTLQILAVNYQFVFEDVDGAALASPRSTRGVRRVVRRLPPDAWRAGDRSRSCLDAPTEATFVYFATLGCAAGEGGGVVVVRHAALYVFHSLPTGCVSGRVTIWRCCVAEFDDVLRWRPPPPAADGRSGEEVRVVPSRCQGCEQLAAFDFVTELTTLMVCSRSAMSMAPALGCTFGFRLPLSVVLDATVTVLGGENDNGAFAVQLPLEQAGSILREACVPSSTAVLCASLFGSHGRPGPAPPFDGEPESRRTAVGELCITFRFEEDLEDFQTLALPLLTGAARHGHSAAAAASLARSMVSASQECLSRTAAAVEYMRMLGRRVSGPPSPGALRAIQPLQPKLSYTTAVVRVAGAPGSRAGETCDGPPGDLSSSPAACIWEWMSCTQQPVVGGADDADRPAAFPDESPHPMTMWGSRPGVAVAAAEPRDDAPDSNEPQWPPPCVAADRVSSTRLRRQRSSCSSQQVTTPPAAAVRRRRSPSERWATGRRGRKRHRLLARPKERRPCTPRACGLTRRWPVVVPATVGDDAFIAAGLALLHRQFQWGRAVQRLLTVHAGGTTRAVRFGTEPPAPPWPSFRSDVAADFQRYLDRWEAGLRAGIPWRT